MKYSISIDCMNYANRIKTNYIYNRYDLQARGGGELYLLYYKDMWNDFYVEYIIIDEDTAELGIGLIECNSIIVRRIAKYIFNRHKNIRFIEYKNSFYPFDEYVICNHFRIELPRTVEELEKRQTSKTRYNLRRQLRLLAEAYGDTHFYRIPAGSEEAEVYMDFYFREKYKGYKTDYGLSYLQYMDVYHTTDIYVLVAGERIVSLLMSCEQCPIVYLENLTYDYDASKYSPGLLLYDYFLKILIENNKKQVFLLGGDYEYKRRYGSIEEQVYCGKILRLVPSIKLSMKRKFKFIAEIIVPKKVYRAITKRIHDILGIVEK